MNDNKDKKAKKALPTQGMLGIRLIVGGYLVYLAYDILSTESVMVPRVGIILFSILFVIAGSVIVVLTLRSFIKGEYIGGKADDTEDEYEEEINQPTIDDNANDNGSERMQ